MGNTTEQSKLKRSEQIQEVIEETLKTIAIYESCDPKDPDLTKLRRILANLEKVKGMALQIESDATR